MKVKEIIENLQKHYKPNDDLIIAWWDKEWFENCFDNDEYQLTDDDLETICSMTINDENVGEQISDYVNEIVADRLNTIEQDEKELEAQQELEQQEKELWGE